MVPILSTPGNRITRYTENRVNQNLITEGDKPIINFLSLEGIIGGNPDEVNLDLTRVLSNCVRDVVLSLATALEMASCEALRSFTV